MQKVLWSGLFGVVLLGAFLLFAVAPFVNWWLPPDVSTYGHEIDFLFYMILAITGVVFVICAAVQVWCMYRYAGEPGRKAQYIHTILWLEVAWTAATSAVLLLVAFTQLGAWSRIKYVSRMPDPNQVVEVSARQFEWRMRYPSPRQMDEWLTNWTKEVPGTGKKGQQLAEEWSRVPQADDVHVVNELHVWKGVKDGADWKGANVRVYLKSRDVLHSFFLPQLRIKQDAVPGKTIPVWFQATDHNTRPNGSQWQDGWKFDAGKKEYVRDKSYVWELACAELCGRDHTKMKGHLYVHESKDDFLAWLKEADAQQKQRQLARE